MTPLGEVTWGTSVDVTCSISTQHVGGTFTLQKTSGSFTKTQSSSSKSATFNIQRVNFDHEGFYQCQYHTTVSTQAFSSPQSDSVRVTVSVPLQQPNISVTSPNGGLFWGPGGAEVTRGSDFVITCCIGSGYPGGHFNLIFSDSNITNVTPAVNNSASFHFPVAEYEHQGNYSCVYEVSLSQQTFSSTRTTTLTITVKLHLFLLVLPVSGGLLLLLLVLVVVCLVHGRRRRANQLQTLSQTQSLCSPEHTMYKFRIVLKYRVED
ncbi:uncharacterized protein LOC115424896 [Sphaeramia orbicularis]|uniref:uncharacterized protein LOC115424896 n=1 Tax=Sphaeramia orbicularis TaxID=375764 RepID=UPI00117FA9F4|nr:uncharacterized protein LOC115424896 [Sphaeramia orbicularis]